jgi:hypothetical protein
MRVLLDVPITYEAGDERIHTPMTRVAVGGVPTKLILDTGSSDHVLTRALAEQASLPMEPAEPGIDSTGAAVPSWSVGQLSVDIDGRSFDLHDAVVIEGPPPFAGWGVGGFLSPQHLHSSAWVVLDLASDRLVLLDASPNQVAAWLGARSPQSRLLTLDRLADDPTILVRAAIEPFEPVVTLLDSGGKSTMFVGSAVPGLLGSEGEAGRGVGGARITGSIVEGRTVQVADARLPVPRLLVRETMATHDGLIGIDVLQGTTMAVSADRTRPVYWLVPPEVIATPSSRPSAGR